MVLLQFAVIVAAGLTCESLKSGSWNKQRVGGTDDELSEDAIIVPAVKSDLLKLGPPLELNTGQETTDSLKSEVQVVKALSEQVEKVKQTYRGEVEVACQRSMNGLAWSLYNLWHNSKSYYGGHTDQANIANMIGVCVATLNGIVNGLMTCQEEWGQCNSKPVNFFPKTSNRMVTSALKMTSNRMVTVALKTLTDVVARSMDLLASSNNEYKYFCTGNENYALNTENAHAISGVYDFVPTLFDMRDFWLSWDTSKVTTNIKNALNFWGGSLCKKAQNKHECWWTHHPCNKPKDQYKYEDPEVYDCILKYNFEGFVNLVATDKTEDSSNSKPEDNSAYMKSFWEQRVKWVQAKLNRDENMLDDGSDVETEETESTKVDSAFQEYSKSLVTPNTGWASNKEQEDEVNEGMHKSAKYGVWREVETFLGIVSSLCGSLDKWFGETAHSYRAGGPKPDPKRSNANGCKATQAKISGAVIGLFADFSEAITCFWGGEGFAWRAMVDNNKKLERMLMRFANTKRDRLCYYGETLRSESEKLKVPQSITVLQVNNTVTRQDPLGPEEMGMYLKRVCARDGFLNFRVKTAAESMTRLETVFRQLKENQPDIVSIG